MTDATDQSIKPPPVSSATLGAEYAPFIYFDGVLTYGVNFGAVQFELAANVIIPVEGGGTRIELVTTARLRCSPHAAADLKQSIEKALEMLTESQAPQQQAPSKLN